MTLLIDYRCDTCGHTEERWAPSPPPAGAGCASCGGEARRVWSPVRLSGAPAPAEPSPGAAQASSGPSLCSQYPAVPGLCHMSESAGRRWLATYLKDGRAVEREIAKQERASSVKAPSMSDAITHSHFGS